MTLRERVTTLDHWLMHRSFHARTDTRDRTLVALTQAANYSRLWLIVGGALAVGGGPRGRRAAERGLVALAIAATVSNGPAKLLTRRKRPFFHARPALIAMPVSSSFPSGHTATAFAFATAASAEAPALAPALFPIAGAIAYSRVHTGVHYPSDVVVGAAMGIASGMIAGSRRFLRPARR